MDGGIANARAATKTARDARRGAAEHTAALAALSTRRRASAPARAPPPRALIRETAWNHDVGARLSPFPHMPDR
ncbi:hypothetical protein [Burkholderia plantarii]|uniref:hypothetical protein n=1 Tax=Burkholderia plantarii TaxID=41899 RepID=UPI0005AF2822|nr:hypothetical protein [Burkholderia plantarii]